MVKSCSAYNCKNRWTKERKISFFKFPVNGDRDVLKHWIAAVGIPGFVPSENSRLCSDHFTADCFRMPRSPSSYRLLKPDAIPTKFLYKSDKDTKDRNMESIKIQRFRANPGGSLHYANYSRYEYRPKPKVARFQLDHHYGKSDDENTSSRGDATFGSAAAEGRSSFEDSADEALTELQHEIVQNIVDNGQTEEYSSALKEFACTLYNQSPRAYTYARKVLCLPQPSVVQMWYHAWLPRDMDVTDEEEYYTDTDEDLLM